MLSDTTGNLSTFTFDSNKTFVSDSTGKLTTVQTGLFNSAITANGGITASTGTFTGKLTANGNGIVSNDTTGYPLIINGNSTGNNINKWGFYASNNTPNNNIPSLSIIPRNNNDSDWNQNSSLVLNTNYNTNNNIVKVKYPININSYSSSNVYYNDGFTYSSSSQYNATNDYGHTYNAFDDNIATYWGTAAGVYSGAGYIGSVSTVVVGETSSILGEWLQIQLPSPIILRQYGILNRDGLNFRFPKSWYLLGSNNATTWNKIDYINLSAIPTAFSTENIFNINNNIPYLIYRIVFTSNFLANSGADYCCITLSNFNLYGFLDSNISLNGNFKKITYPVTNNTDSNSNYIYKASSVFSNLYIACKAFDNDINTFWHSTASGIYNGSSGAYVGTQTTSVVNDSSVAGEWLQINLPANTIIKAYGLTNRNDSYVDTRYPKKWHLLGSNATDDTQWYKIDTIELPTIPSNVRTENTYYIYNNNISYSKYRIVFASTFGGDCINIARFDLYTSNSIEINDVFINNGGITAATGSKICLGNTCISETDFQNLANLATTYVKKSDLRITSGNTSNNGYVISATGCQASTTASGNPCTIVPWNTYKTTTFS